MGPAADATALAATLMSRLKNCQYDVPGGSFSRLFPVSGSCKVPSHRAYIGNLSSRKLAIIAACHGARLVCVGVWARLHVI
jgi:hypothetical protein